MTSRHNDELESLIGSNFRRAADELDGSNVHCPSTRSEEWEDREEILFLRLRSVIWDALALILFLGLAFVFVFQDNMADWAWSGTLPRNPALAASRILDLAPIIVRHSARFRTHD
jgi:membrane dipeptidase